MLCYAFAILRIGTTLLAYSQSKTPFRKTHEKMGFYPGSNPLGLTRSNNVTKAQIFQHEIAA